MSIPANLDHLSERIAAACRRAHRDPAQVTLVAVSKGFGPERILEAIAAGVRVFGENRVAEAEEKFAAVPRQGLELHLVGHLQTNKVKPAAELFDVVEAVDSLRLAQALELRCASLNRLLPVLLEVNVGREPNKFGFLQEEVEAAFGALLEHEHLQIRGLMTVAPMVAGPDEARPVFRTLRVLRDQLVEQHPGVALPHLSMGMSDDFEAAILEGATLIRLGRAIFGPRQVIPAAHPDKETG